MQHAVLLVTLAVLLLWCHTMCCAYTQAVIVPLSASLPLALVVEFRKALKSSC